MMMWVNLLPTLEIISGIYWKPFLQSEMIWHNFIRGGVNQMWILKKSKDLLEYIHYKFLSSCNNIKTFDFSTLYTTIPHSKLKDKLRKLVQLCFIKKNSVLSFISSSMGYMRSTKSPNLELFSEMTSSI
jgi:hypothetical protein